MKIGGIDFPYDRTRDTTGHGPVIGFIMRCHPLAVMLVSAIMGLTIGWVER